MDYPGALTTSLVYEDGERFDQINFGMLLHWSGQEWEMVRGGQDMDATYTEVDGVPLCEHSIPDSVRERIWCY